MAALPKPMSRTGKHTARWHYWRERQYGLAASRAHNHCEVCGRPARDPEHTFRRGNIVSEPLASHHSLIAAVCRPCHSRINDDPESADASELQRTALLRARDHFRLRGLHIGGTHKEHIEAARELERILKADTETWQALLEEAGVA